MVDHVKPEAKLNLLAPTDYVAGCSTFDMEQGKMTPCPSPSR